MVVQMLPTTLTKIQYFCTALQADRPTSGALQVSPVESGYEIDAQTIADELETLQLTSLPLPNPMPVAPEDFENAFHWFYA